MGGGTDETAKAENRLHPRCKQMKDARPFEGINTDKNSSELKWQETTLDFSSWNAGPKRGDVTSSMVGSFHVIMVQEAETHHDEFNTGAEQQFSHLPGCRPAHLKQQEHPLNPRVWKSKKKSRARPFTTPSA